MNYLGRGGLSKHRVRAMTLYNKTKTFLLPLTVHGETSMFVANRVGCRSCFKRRTRVLVTRVKRCRDRRCAGRVFCSVVQSLFPGIALRFDGIGAGPVGCLWMG